MTSTRRLRGHPQLVVEGQARRQREGELSGLPLRLVLRPGSRREAATAQPGKTSRQQPGGAVAPGVARVALGRVGGGVDGVVGEGVAECRGRRRLGVLGLQARAARVITTARKLHRAIRIPMSSPHGSASRLALPLHPQGVISFVHTVGRREATKTPMAAIAVASTTIRSLGSGLSEARIVRSRRAGGSAQGCRTGIPQVRPWLQHIRRWVGVTRGSPSPETE